MSEKELTYGETIKKPFPKLEDIELIKIETPEWFFSSISNRKYGGTELTSTVFSKAKSIHENSKDFKVTWKLKQTDPHAEIKAQHEEALKKYDAVKVEVSIMGKWKEVTENNFFDNLEYRLRYYNIDWNKLLSWSYANGEFVECECTDYEDFRHFDTSQLMGFGSGRVNPYWAGTQNQSATYKYCRLAPNVTIKDEWLKEVK